MVVSIVLQVGNCFCFDDIEDFFLPFSPYWTGGLLLAYFTGFVLNHNLTVMVLEY